MLVNMGGKLILLVDAARIGSSRRRVDSCSPFEPGRWHFPRVGKMLRCSRHSWEFDIGTRRSRSDPYGKKVRALSGDVESGSGLDEEPHQVDDSVDDRLS